MVNKRELQGCPCAGCEIRRKCEAVDDWTPALRLLSEAPKPQTVAASSKAALLSRITAELASAKLTSGKRKRLTSGKRRKVHRREKAVQPFRPVSAFGPALRRSKSAC